MLCIEDPAWRPQCERVFMAAVNKVEDKVTLGPPGVLGTGVVALAHPLGLRKKAKGKKLRHPRWLLR